MDDTFVSEPYRLQEFYDAFAPFYDDFYEALDYHAWCAILQRELNELTPTPRHILEVGCGTGAMLRELAAQPGQVCVGMDISRGMLNACLSKAHKTQPPALVQGDLFALSFCEESFDAVLGIFSLLNFYPKAGRAVLLREIQRVLKPNGVFLADFATVQRYDELREQAGKQGETSHAEAAFNIHQTFPELPETHSQARTKFDLHDRFVIERTLTTGGCSTRHRLYFLDDQSLRRELTAADFKVIKTTPLLHDSSAPVPRRLITIGRKSCNDSMSISSTSVSRNFASRMT